MTQKSQAGIYYTNQILVEQTENLKHAEGIDYYFGKPPPPVNYVSENILGLKAGVVSIRNLFIIPWFLALITLSYLHITEILESWESTESRYVDFIERRKEMYGDNFFEVTTKQSSIDIYNDIGEDLKMSYEEYWHYRMHSTAGGEFPWDLKVDIGYSIFLAIGMLLLLYIIITWKRNAMLYFDRERRIVYTWKNNEVHAHHYDLVFYGYNIQSLIFNLRTYKTSHKKPLRYRAWAMMPSGTPYYNNWTLYEPALAYIVKFMEEGRDAVRKENYQGKKNWAFFEHKKPQDFDRQLDTILEKITEESESFTDDLKPWERKL